MDAGLVLYAVYEDGGEIGNHTKGAAGGFIGGTAGAFAGGFLGEEAFENITKKKNT